MQKKWGVFSGAVVLMIMAWMPVSQAYVTPGMSPMAKGVININTAGVTDFMQLFGVDTELAAAIVNFRDEHGPFREIDALLAVEGMDARRLDAIRSNLTLEGANTLDVPDGEGPS